MGKFERGKRRKWGAGERREKTVKCTVAVFYHCNNGMPNMDTQLSKREMSSKGLVVPLISFCFFFVL